MTESPPIGLPQCGVRLGIAVAEQKRWYRLALSREHLFFAVLTSREACEPVLALLALFAALVVFAPLASARQCGDKPAILTFGSTPRSGPYSCPVYTPHAVNRDSPEFSLDHMGPDNASRSMEDSTVQLSNERGRHAKPPDFNRDIFYRNKLEFSQDVGWLPINIPFPFDFLLSDQYQIYPLKYTLVPIISSLRWQLDSIKGPLFLRGNWELDISGAVVAIPRGPETHYYAYIMGMRRNFVPRNWKLTPYFDWRAGLGDINAKGPLGVPYAQGQNFTFTLNLGSGVRYNFGPRWAVSAGLNWMHISNANLSEHSYDPTRPNPYGFENFGINVYGPMFGVDLQLRRHPRHSE